MKILTFGDSHSQFLKLTNELKEINSNLRGITCNVVSLPGATIAGFGKRGSTLNSGQIFIKKVEEYKPDFLCFALGQVDIELGYYYKRIVKKEDVNFDTFATELVDKYLKNTSQIIKQLGYSEEQVIFKGVNLSVLTNNRNKAINYTSRIITESVGNEEAVMKLRANLAKMFPSNMERANYHTIFNDKIKASSFKLGMSYFDINSFIAKSENEKTVDMKHIPAGLDHHLIDSLYIRNVHLNQLVHTASSIII